MIEKLLEERKRQEDNHNLVLSWVTKQKDTWFSPSKYTVNTHGHVSFIFPGHCGMRSIIDLIVFVYFTSKFPLIKYTIVFL